MASDAPLESRPRRSTCYLEIPTRLSADDRHTLLPDTDGEEWDQLESSSALGILVEPIFHAEYNGMITPHRRRDSLELRVSALQILCVGEVSQTPFYR